jgi:hypothetical protein
MDQQKTQAALASTNAACNQHQEAQNFLIIGDPPPLAQAPSGDNERCYRAPGIAPDPLRLVDPELVFRARAEARFLLWQHGVMTWAETGLPAEIEPLEPEGAP